MWSFLHSCFHTPPTTGEAAREMWTEQEGQSHWQKVCPFLVEHLEAREDMGRKSLLASRGNGPKSPQRKRAQLPLKDFLMCAPEPEEGGGRGDNLRCQWQGSYRVKDTCHHPTPLSAVNQRRHHDWNTAGWQLTMSPHMQLKLKCYQWLTSSPVLWIRPVSNVTATPNQCISTILMTQSHTVIRQPAEAVQRGGST